MENAVFVVNNEPYCIWEANIRHRNLEFIDGIDDEYFDYVLDTNIKADDEKRASISLRMAFHHSLETMFSLLGAYVQAPYCVYAWLAKCSNTDLRSIVNRINHDDPNLFTRLKLKNVAWDSIAQLIFKFYLPDTEKNVVTTKLFAQLWHYLANEFLNENYINEYNSLKHGFRVRAGGFGLAIGREPSHCVAPSEEAMNIISYSEWGTTFYKLETVGDKKKNRSLRSRMISLNWNIEKTALLIQLISVSIANIKSALKITNGINPSSIKFFRPDTDDAFERPWSICDGESFGVDPVINLRQIVHLSREDLLKRLKSPSS